MCKRHYEKVTMKKIKPLVLSAFIMLNALPAIAQVKMTDDEIQNVISFAHSRTMGLDHFKFYTGLKDRTRPFNNLYYRVELFKELPQTISDELIRFDGIQYYISEESYKKQECVREIATGCNVSSIFYANLVDKISLNDADGSIDDFIEINGEIEDSVLTRILKIVNSSMESIIAGNLVDEVGSVIGVKIDPYLTLNSNIVESTKGTKPKRISIKKSIKGHRFYNIAFYPSERINGNGFELRIKFSGINGNKIHLEISRGPIA